MYVIPAVVGNETIFPLVVVVTVCPLLSLTTSPEAHGDSTTHAEPTSLTIVTGATVPSALIDADTRNAPYARNVVKEAAPSE